MKKSFYLLITLLTMFGLLIPSRVSVASNLLQTNSLEQQAADLLAEMTPEQRVGQVFLISFSGSGITADSPIVNLIQEKHIGGVVLSAKNDNFTIPEYTTTAVQELIRNLQTENWQATQSPNTNPPISPYVPLLVGISQEGDLYPYDQILNGLTVLPSQMAIGATWNTDYARSIGSILGSELKALGINLFFGPSLDVLDTYQMENDENLGVRTFGGNPFWVGEMGKAYVKGMHEGSRDSIAVIAAHFPGQGSSDRDPAEEIATVRKPLEQLTQIELAPFFAVTGNADESSQEVEGLLLSNIRYQGFQGNIRPTTKPVSFDPAALEQIMSLPQIADWRKRGGITISDNLGNPAVRKFFDPLNSGFDARQVAKSALLAGNDIIYLGDVISTIDPDQMTTISRTVDFFVQKYREDNVFQLRVDQAVLKILMMKLEMYPQFALNSVLPVPADLQILNQSQNKVAEVAQKSVTLISPDKADFDNVLPNPPSNNERIVFVSDMVTYRQCSSCIDQTIFPADSIRNAVNRLYGPGSGDQILSSKMMSYTFDNLRLLIENGTGVENLQNDLNAANWIVFSFTEFNRSVKDAEVFRRFFIERPDLIRNKKIIGMAFNAPYFLDATDISKFTAYYAFYSKAPEFFDVAAKVLFQELTPVGEPPVSVPGIGYDLTTAVSPDPDQIIPLFIESPTEGPNIINTPPSGYSRPLLYKSGDTVPIRAGVIVDNNGNMVPDGTVVKFLIDTLSANGTLEQIEIQTQDGIARITYLVPSIGSLELRATADPALISQILRLDITDAGGVVTSFEPTPAPEETEISTATVMPTPTLESTATRRHQEGTLSVTDWLTSTLLILGCCLLFNWFARKSLSMKWNIGTTLSMAIGGNLAYIYLALGLPGADGLIRSNGTTFTLMVVIAGLITGLAVGFVIYWIVKPKISEKL